MRPDLNKLLCEHERYRSDDGYKNYRNLKKFNAKAGEELENLPTRESMKKRYGWNVKEFGENLNPLYGLVRKYVGKKWDDFYSDLCKGFDRRSVINQHILQHLDWYVERNIRIDKDGTLQVPSSWGTFPIESSSAEYYVDPRDGIIKKNKKKSAAAVKKEREEKKRLERAKVFRQLDDNNVLRLIKGVWYHFEMKPLQPATVTYSKPLGMEAFNASPSWSLKKKVMKTWDELNQKERERFGTKKIVGAVRDLFLEQDVALLHGRPCIAKTELRTQELTDKYHATKKTASRKLLKKAGIV